MSNTTTVSLAILKVNWDTLHKDYIENFVPFVTEAIRLMPVDVVSLPDLQKSMLMNFGLNIPQNVLAGILKRVCRQHYISYDSIGPIYRRNPMKLDTFKFYEDKQQVLRNHEDLISSLRQYCSDTYSMNWSSKQAEDVLQAYLEENQVHVMLAANWRHCYPASIISRPK